MSEPAPDMTAAELREILEALGWSQRYAGEFLAAIGERRMRELAAGKRPVPPELAAWLRLTRTLTTPPTP